MLKLYFKIQPKDSTIFIIKYFFYHRKIPPITQTVIPFFLKRLL